MKYDNPYTLAPSPWLARLAAAPRWHTLPTWMLTDAEKAERDAAAERLVDKAIAETKR